MDLKEKLADYTDTFRKNDREYQNTDISDCDAAAFLLEQIPRIEIPDKTIERAYYFRFWVYRKHIRNTPSGHIITEFLPDVPWAGAFNSINCATPFHLLEGRWLKDAPDWLEEYIDFFLDGVGDPFAYSMPFVKSIWDYATARGREHFLTNRYEKIRLWHERRLEKTVRVGTLYQSVDDRDGMEYSISGSGLRPTINAYIYADALALMKIAQLADKPAEADAYGRFADELRGGILDMLWDGDFFRTIPTCAIDTFGNIKDSIPDAHNVRELIGYIPWMYGIPKPEHDGAWKYVLQSDCFYTPYGLTTADQSHPRFMEKHEHECLWNGPVWPFATGQVLKALAEKKRTYPDGRITNEEYCKLLHDYAAGHKRVISSGEWIDWIDENIDPRSGRWLSRDVLKKMGFPTSLGGVERGKDYNHSLFCDLVLSDLLGISAEDGMLRVNPLIPASWEYFKVENLHIRGKRYQITYSRGDGVGVSVT